MRMGEGEGEREEDSNESHFIQLKLYAPLRIFKTANIPFGKFVTCGPGNVLC